MIAVIDYGSGNIFSIGQALKYLGAEYSVTSDPDKIMMADRMILPGVGAFGNAMEELKKKFLIKTIKQFFETGKPLLGICVGMQLFADSSEEFGLHKGLSIIPAKVKKIPKGHSDLNDFTRIPNVGWRSLHMEPNDTYLKGLSIDEMVYFVHSYAAVIENKKYISATIKINGTVIPAIIRRNNAIGYQFHPEKSGPVGLELLQRFLKFS